MKIGYACITLDQNGEKNTATQYKSSTVQHMSGLAEADKQSKLRGLVVSNLAALSQVVAWLATLPAPARMYRITSDLLPLYTHPVSDSVYQDRVFAREIEQGFALIGEQARLNGIRLSTHPGQYTVLNSLKSEQTRLSAVSEMDYHAYMATSMGYTDQSDGYCINLHGGARLNSLDQALEGWDWSWPRLSSSAQRLMTLENDEFSWSLDHIIVLAARFGVRVVPDIHHHFVAEGEWLAPNSPLILRAAASWQGRRGKMHVSMPDPVLLGYPLPDAPPETVSSELPSNLTGASRSKLRAHSRYIWHPGVVELLSRYSLEWDIMAECKAKNLAAHALLEQMNGPMHQAKRSPIKSGSI